MSDSEKAVHTIQKFEREAVDVVDRVGYFYANLGTLDQVYGVGNLSELTNFCNQVGLKWLSVGNFKVVITKAEPEN